MDKCIKCGKENLTAYKETPEGPVCVSCIEQERQDAIKRFMRVNNIRRTRQTKMSAW